MAKDNDLKTPNVPPLRFPGFTDEWEQVCLGEITTNFNLRNREKIDYPMYSVTNNRGFVPQSEQFEDREMKGEDVKAYKIIHSNDFAYNPARINVGSIAKYNGKEPCMISSLYVCFKANDGIDEEWLMHLLRTPKVQYYYQLNGEGGVRIYLFYPNFARIRTSIPNKEEQRKIANLLNKIDERIATQNKIIDNLQSLIKGLRERIFAPMLSNLIKLGAIANITNGSGDVQDAISKYADDLYPFFDRSEDMKYFSSFGFDAEAIIYAGEGSEFLPRYYNGKFALHQRCYAITNFNKDYIPRFVYHFLSTQNNYFIRKAVGSTVPSLRMDTFQNIGIPIVDKTLQSYVSNRLDTICRLYDYEKQILSLYRNQKDYLLQNLFI